MSNFEFTFSLFGLLLGFSLIEVLAGLTRVLNARRHIRLGWLTPMLGIFLVLDLTSFWSGAWYVRELIPPVYGALVIGLVVSALYYLAASLVFPATIDESSDLDAHYFAHRRQVLAGVLLANTIAWVPLDFMMGGADTFQLIQVAAFYLLGIAVMFVDRKGISILLLAALIALYLLSGVTSLVDYAGSSGLPDAQASSSAGS